MAHRSSYKVKISQASEVYLLVLRQTEIQQAEAQGINPIHIQADLTKTTQIMPNKAPQGEWCHRSSPRTKWAIWLTQMFKCRTTALTTLILIKVVSIISGEMARKISTTVSRLKQGILKTDLGKSTKMAAGIRPWVIILASTLTRVLTVRGN